MKYLMKVGDQLDLQVSYDGGAVDGVTYNAPDGFDNKVSVTSAGVVTALGLGEGVVNVLSGGVIVGSIVFEVLSEAAHTAQQGIRDGSKMLSVGADIVQVVTTLVKISPTVSQWNQVGPPGYILFGGGGRLSGYGAVGTGGAESDRIDYLWDGNPNTYWFATSNYYDGNVAGYLSDFSTTVKEVRIKANPVNLTSRPTQITVYGSNLTPYGYSDASGLGSPDFRVYDNTGWTLIGSGNVQWGNTVGEDRVVTLQNSTAYKHYKIKIGVDQTVERNVALAGMELWGLS